MDARWNGLVAALAAMPDVVERLAAAHVPDPDGRCCVCRASDRAAEQFPCSLASLAAEARATRR